MKKILLASLFLLFLNNISYAENDIAVVDLQQIVSNSSQVKALKHEHSKRIGELERIINNARGEIANEKDPAKVLLLEDKYTREFNNKKEALEKDYNARLGVIENEIRNEIAKKAQKDGYEYVFAKSVVLYGGKDITAELSKNVK